MSDSSRNQRRFRTFNVINSFNCEALGIDIALCLPAGRITHYLDNWLNIMVIYSKFVVVLVGIDIQAGGVIRAGFLNHS
ncbi:MAG: hypothetical protein J6574_08985 [Gilliamella sp.]|nr:hypothetical protein [Gilliamella sp.]